MEPLVRANRQPVGIGPDGALIPLEAALRSDDLREVHALEAGELAREFYRRRLIDRLLAGHDAASLRALLPQNPRELARVDVGNRDDLAALEKVGERFVSAPIARDDRQIADDETGGVDLGRLEILGRGAGVTDVRTGQCNDLTGIGRVGENFLVARQCGIENDFACGVALRSN